MSNASLVSCWSPNFAKETTTLRFVGCTTPLEFASWIGSLEPVIFVSPVSFPRNEMLESKKRRELKKFHFFYELGKSSSFTRFATYIESLMVYILLFKCKENVEN
jgi:hypothetical protein